MPRYPLALLFFMSFLFFGGATYAAAFINDVAVKSESDTGYKVMSVDGKQPVRRSGFLVTLVPYVEVESGERSIALEKRDSPGEILEIVHFFKDGEVYRLSFVKDSYIFVEDVE
ncbi:MAG TPA: hypothetical protein DDX54_07405 [Rhodospirillaceae bacterium]|jgi:hypothetical protein|nr:hypothetical protein [Rhodospirillaceae bacterium]